MKLGEIVLSVDGDPDPAARFVLARGGINSGVDALKSVGLRKEGIALDLVTAFRVAFVVGIVAIPILYVLFVRGAAGGDRDRTRNGHEERGDR